MLLSVLITSHHSRKTRAASPLSYPTPHVRNKLEKQQLKTSIARTNTVSCGKSGNNIWSVRFDNISLPNLAQLSPAFVTISKEHYYGQIDSPQA